MIEVSTKYIINLVFISTSLLIKICRLIYFKQLKYALIGLKSFYYGFLLVGFYIIFQNQAVDNYFNTGFY